MLEFDAFVPKVEGSDTVPTIWCNVPITRRKSFYIVTGADGRTAFKNRHFWPCVEYLESQGVRRYELRASEPPKRARVAAILCNEGTLQWQN